VEPGQRRGSLLAILITSTVILGLSYGFWHSLRRPLNNIEEAIKRFNAGDFSARAPASAIPEINHLCLTLNSAAAQLEDVEVRRRALVADLSHELGTPLTVIKGYLELARDSRVAVNRELLVQLLEEAKGLAIK
jgi:signal transduction histidine kinase